MPTLSSGVDEMRQSVESRAREAAGEPQSWQSDGVKQQRLAKGLGWFSLALGLTELIEPRVVAWLAGTKNHSSLIRAYGLREIAAGAGILGTDRRAGWLWSRVAGDAIDLASLVQVLASQRRGRGRAAFSIAAVAGVTALDVLCARRLSAGR